MAKKTQKKNETEIVDIQPLVDEKYLTEGVIIPNKQSISSISIRELETYERLLRMLVLYYEQNLRLDESEGRPVMSDNRNKYTRLSILHKRLIGYIENKILTLETYEWEN